MKSVKDWSSTALPIEETLTVPFPVKLTEDTQYEIYLNARFGYSVEYPDIFGARRESDNGDGIEFESADGKYRLTVWGGHNVQGEDGNALLKSRMEEIAHVVPDTENSGAEFYTVNYSDDGGQDGVEHIFHEYGVVNSDKKAAYVLRYPKSESKLFAEVKNLMKSSLKMRDEASESITPANLGICKLKDGKVYMGSEEQECDVEEVAPGIGGNIRYWAALGEEDGGAVYFFDKKGACVASLPLDGRDACQGIHFSPDGERFLLVDGSPMRPDVTFKLYGAAPMEHKADFPGIKFQAEWIDPVRFVFTRIEVDVKDGMREGAYLNLGYGLRLSVALFDTAAFETAVLKEATDKQNFSFGGVIEDGNAVTVTEESVKSEKDWADEEKIKTREIRVEVPAAG